MLLTDLSLGAVFSNVKEPPHTVIHSSPAHIVTPKTCKYTEDFHLNNTLNCYYHILHTVVRIQLKDITEL